MNHGLSSSQYTLLYVSPSKDGTIIPFIRQPRDSPAHIRRGWRGGEVVVDRRRRREEGGGAALTISPNQSFIIVKCTAY